MFLEKAPPPLCSCRRRAECCGSLAEAACTPAEVLDKLNGLLVEDFPAGKFVTLVYAVLDPATRSITFASAGHLQSAFGGRQRTPLPRHRARTSVGLELWRLFRKHGGLYRRARASSSTATASARPPTTKTKNTDWIASLSTFPALALPPSPFSMTFAFLRRRRSPPRRRQRRIRSG